MLEAVVFDFDGVIADTPKYYFKYMKQYLASVHGGIADDDIKDLLGHTFAEKFEHLNKKYSLSLSRGHFVETTSEQMRKELESSAKANPELSILLLELHSRDVCLAIASGNSRKNINFFVEKFGFGEYFSKIVCIDDVSNPKPHPEVYEKAVRALGVNPNCSVAIEDTPIGIAAAIGAGMRAVAIPNDLTRSLDFSAASLMVKNFSELNYGVFAGLVK
ncbi:MAG: HAD-IA family hydrolase [archaeon]|nr:HAD-IA family hydrolase [archaeon]